MSGTTLSETVPQPRAGTRTSGRAARLLIALCSFSLVSAAPPLSGLEGLGREVSDEELSDMRGKFVRASSVHFFGVELLQSWQTPDGVTLAATLQFNVDFANGAGNLEGATPSIVISWDRICAICADPSMDVASTDGSGNQAFAASSSDLSIAKFGTIQGLVQTQEIAGSDNSVLNALSVSVSPDAGMQSLPDGEVASIGSSASHVTSGGEVIQFVVARNELGISMTRGDDSVRQGISGELNQAAQHVMLQSSLNNIRNEMAISIGVNDLGQINQHNVQQALSAMKGRGL